MKKCPHEHIQYCPLYVGMHIADGPSCWPKNGSDPAEHGCAVEQGLAEYEDLVAEFWHAHPDEFAACTLAERQRESKEQRQRNLKAAGLH